jgi:luciferase family oxidoreductase group 1
MLPNHSPLVIAEQFGTLESLYPGRIDLGLGRAPGSDQLTARALRRNLSSDPDEFPQDVVELLGYFAAPQPNQAVRAVPGAGLNVPLWILGSSLYGAQVAAAFGLPFAFASHFAPALMMQAIQIYRDAFRPSQQLDKPYVMLGFNVFAADSDEQAQLLASSVQQAFIALRSGRPMQLQPPLAGYADRLTAQEKAILADVLSCSATGSPQTVRSAIASFLARTQADELILTCNMFEHAARLRSYEIAAQVRDSL